MQRVNLVTWHSKQYKLISGKRRQHSLKFSVKHEPYTNLILSLVPLTGPLYFIFFYWNVPSILESSVFLSLVSFLHFHSLLWFRVFPCSSCKLFISIVCPIHLCIIYSVYLNKVSLIDICILICGQWSKFSPRSWIWRSNSEFSLFWNFWKEVKVSATKWELKPYWLNISIHMQFSQ